jgi:hypothetical protein
LQAFLRIDPGGRDMTFNQHRSAGKALLFNGL